MQIVRGSALISGGDLMSGGSARRGGGLSPLQAPPPCRTRSSQQCVKDRGGSLGRAGSFAHPHHEIRSLNEIQECERESVREVC